MWQLREVDTPLKAGVTTKNSALRYSGQKCANFKPECTDVDYHLVKETARKACALPYISQLCFSQKAFLALGSQSRNMLSIG